MRESSARTNVDIDSDYNKKVVDIYNRIVEEGYFQASHGQAKEAYSDIAQRVTDYITSQEFRGSTHPGAVTPPHGKVWFLWADMKMLTAVRIHPSPAQRLFDSPAPVPISSPVSHPHLKAALADLKECTEEAHEKDFPVPTETALQNAERLLREMCKRLPRRFEVYPMPNGAIAIQASHPPEIAVSVLCESDGGALCLVSASDDDSRRAWYSKAEVLPDGFLNDALDALRSFKS